MSKVQVVLERDVPNLGRAGELKEVAAGYARNYLFPRALASLATPIRQQFWQARLKNLEIRQAASRAEAQNLAQTLQSQVVRIPKKVGPQGKLFGSVGPTDIAKAIQQALGVEIKKAWVHLPQPLKTVGPAVVEIHCHPAVTVPITVDIVPE